VLCSMGAIPAYFFPPNPPPSPYRLFKASIQSAHLAPPELNVASKGVKASAYTSTTDKGVNCRLRIETGLVH